MMGELVVRDDDILVDQTSFVYVVDEPIEDCLAAYLEKRLWEVLCKGIQTSGISCSKNETFHVFSFYLEQSVCTLANVDAVFAFEFRKDFEVFVCNFLLD